MSLIIIALTPKDARLIALNSCIWPGLVRVAPRSNDFEQFVNDFSKGSYHKDVITQTWTTTTNDTQIELNSKKVFNYC